MSAAQREPGVANRDDPDELRHAVEALTLMTERSFRRLFLGWHTRAHEAALVATLSELWTRGLGLS
jgi:hypothetical protein